MRMFLVLMLLASSAHALTVDAKLDDPAQEARALALFTSLRCMVCAGESLADSPASVAADMRREVRTAIKSGKTDAEVRDKMVSHYGERVLMMPEKNVRNAPLWLVPLLLLAGGGLLAWRGVFREGK